LECDAVNRRQKLGITAILIWAAIVVAIAIATHQLAAFALLGATPLIAAPFRKR